MHLGPVMTILAIPVMALVSLFFFSRRAFLPAIFAIVAACGLIGAAANGGGSCISTVQSASSACAN